MPYFTKRIRLNNEMSIEVEKIHENSLSFTDVRVSKFLFKRFEVALYVQKEADRSTWVELAFCFVHFHCSGSSAMLTQFQPLEGQEFSDVLSSHENPACVRAFGAFAF